MNKKEINIVSFDNPFPPNYGGVIDVYYKIKALHEIGYTIYLHCFVKNVPHEFQDLKAITAKVYFYKIKNNPLFLFAGLPFSVISRSDSSLSENILKNKAPILFEGLKTTCLIHDVRLKNYTKILRLQNIEEDYFDGIAKSENSIFKKIAFKIEAKKYRKYKDVFSQLDGVITLSKFENEIIKKSVANTNYVPVFHGNKKVEFLDGFGKYAIYHGDLNTSDNKKCVTFLIEIFKNLPTINLVIASGSNQDFVSNQIGNLKNVKFVLLQDFEHLKRLLNQAHISICWSFQKSGTKLKVINSLFNSRFCIINENIIDDEIVSDLCILVKEKEVLQEQIHHCFTTFFSDYETRKIILEEYMNDYNNAKKIDELIKNSIQK